jgi:2-polyprenyl-6-methoxyphenol hydroxylase-like FAD-dependent oxidoreductase
MLTALAILILLSWNAAGNGASMAFRDSSQLAKQLTDPQNKSLDDAVSAYNTESCRRCSAAMKEGARNNRMWHKTGLGHYGTVAVFLFFSQVSWLSQAWRRMFA